MRVFAPIYGGLGAVLSICKYSRRYSSIAYLLLAVFISCGISTMISEYRMFLLCVSLVRIDQPSRCFHQPNYSTSFSVRLLRVRSPVSVPRSIPNTTRPSRPKLILKWMTVFPMLP